MTPPTTQHIYRITGVLVFGLLWLSVFWKGQHLSPSYFTHKHTQSHVSNHKSSPVAQQQQQPQVTVVVASRKKDNTSWLTDGLPDWDHRIYVTDDFDAALTVPLNKGREAMVYLTHIIDNYDDLSPVTIFRHARRYQWHSDDPIYDGLRVLRRIQIPYILEKGYTNLRCIWTIGCPVELHPHLDEVQRSPIDQFDNRKPSASWYYKEAFESLFPGEQVPEEVGAPCCAEFAVTDRVIRERPRSDYERYRRWLIETDSSDYVSGRTLEYSWHIIFGQEAVSCPNAPTCYCKLYGLCNLKCENEGVCEEHYYPPEYSTMPKGWPDFDRDGNWQNATEM